MTTTYEITHELRDLLIAMDYLNEQIDARAMEIAERGGELPEELASMEAGLLKQIERVVGEGEQKLENLALVRRDILRERDVEATNKAYFEAEVERYRRRQVSKERTIDRLKRLSASLFDTMGLRRHDGARIKTRVQRGPMKLTPVDPEDPPARFCMETWTLPATMAANILARMTDDERANTTRRRVFFAASAKAAAQVELDKIERAKQRIFPDFEFRPGERWTILGDSVVAEFGTVVVDW